MTEVLNSKKYTCWYCQFPPLSPRMAQVAPFEIESPFPSWDALKSKIQDWAVAEHFAFHIVKKDRTQADYRCHDWQAGCAWCVYAIATIQEEGEEIKIKTIESRHTCAGAYQTPCNVHNHQSWLCRTVPQHLFVTRNTDAWDIVECMQMHYNVRVTNKAAKIIRRTLIDDRKIHQCEQFKKVPAYLMLLQRNNPHVFTDL